jgi:hypothetical protein
MFSLSASGQSMMADEFRVMTDGLEYAFVARYRGTDAVAGKFQAHYLHLAEQMPPGALRVQTEAGGRLHEVLLTRAQAHAAFTFGRSPKTLTTNGISPELPALEVNSPVVLTNHLPITASAGNKNRLVGGTVLAFVAIFAVGFLFNRLRS